MKFLVFKTNFCQPCQQLTPIMEKVKQQGIPVQIIDAEAEYELSSEWGIRSVPTTILVNGGGFEVNRTVGVKPESFYVDLYKKHLA